MAKKPKDCPLFQHRNGQWCKKVKGKLRYFGTDLDEALKRWADEKDDLLAGREPAKATGEPTLAELANLYIDHRKGMVAEGEIVKRSYNDDASTLRRLVSMLGAKYQPSRMQPLDFARLKESLAVPIKRTTPIRGGIRGMKIERRGLNTVAGDIRRIRGFLNWCAANKLIPTPEYGTQFSGPSTKAQRRHKLQKGRSDLAPHDLLAIIEECSVTFKPLVMLGINAGIGNRDLAQISMAQLPDLGSGEIWMEVPRGKTGKPRRFCLWPETVQAIRAYLEKRPTAAGHSAKELLFLTKYGLPWVREHKNDRKDSVGTAFTRFRKAAGVTGHSFYDLRRTFQTVAEGTLDFPAVQHVMGHGEKANDMAATYRQHIEDARIRRVVMHVHGWLYGGESCTRT